MGKASIQPANNTRHGIAVVGLNFEKGINDSKTKQEGLPLTLLSKKPGFITSIKTGRGITGTAAQRYLKINDEAVELATQILFR